MPVSSVLKASKIIGQWKAFYRQRIPPSRCARKGIVDIDILVTGDPNITIYFEAHAEFFFSKIWLYYSLVFMGPCHYAKNKKILMSDPWEKWIIDRRMDWQTYGLMNMNSKDLPVNTGVQKIFKKNTKIIEKLRKKWIMQKSKSPLTSFFSRLKGIVFIYHIAQKSCKET